MARVLEGFLKAFEVGVWQRRGGVLLGFWIMFERR